MIQVLLDRNEVRCGQQLRATVQWQHEAAPHDLRVELQWFTEGRGDHNVGTVDRLEMQSQQGTIPPVVEAVLTVPPVGPVSYDGAMIRIRWRVRATLGLTFKRDPDADAELLVLPAVIETA